MEICFQYKWDENGEMRRRARAARCRGKPWPADDALGAVIGCRLPGKLSFPGHALLEQKRHLQEAAD